MCIAYEDCELFPWWKHRIKKQDFQVTSPLQDHCLVSLLPSHSAWYLSWNHRWVTPAVSSAAVIQTALKATTSKGCAHLAMYTGAQWPPAWWSSSSHKQWSLAPMRMGPTTTAKLPSTGLSKLGNFEPRQLIVGFLLIHPIKKGKHGHLETPQLCSAVLWLLKSARQGWGCYKWVYFQLMWYRIMTAGGL